MEKSIFPVNELRANAGQLILDSSARNVDIDPDTTDFSGVLNTAVSYTRRIFHTNLQWTPSIYTHTPTNGVISITFPNAASDAFGTWRLIMTPFSLYSTMFGSAPEFWTAVTAA